MARIEWVRLRLENWALWHERGRGGGLGFATQAAFLSDVAMRDQPLEARIPVDEVEASVTHLAVEGLKLGHGHLHQTLRLYYLKGLGIKGTATTMQRAESTIKAQLAQADHLLAVWFNARAERQRQVAAQVRQQIEAARPVKLLAPLPEPPKRKRRTLKLKG